MADAVTATLQLRLSRREKERLLWALLLSLAAHLLLFGGYKLAQHFHWQSDLLLPRWLKFSRKLEQVIAAKQEAMAQPQEPPLVFINVSEAQATADAPPDAKYYSDKSSRAANPDADKDTGIPKISGTQEQIPKTEDTQRNPFDRLMPSPARPAAPQAEAKAKPAQPVGDLTMAKPEFNPRPDMGAAEQSRPRRLADARRRLENLPPGEKMKQDGGVKQKLEFSAVDAKATPFGAYDAALIDAVSQCWYRSLDETHYDGYQRGKVVLQFVLNHKGEVRDVKVTESTVGTYLSLLCEMAVVNPAPYGDWPSDLRRLLYSDQRKLQFTFYYY